MPTRDKKLEQLVALSHILNSFGGMQQVQQSGALGLAGIDQRERQDVRQEALAKLGLQMQQSQQEALAKHQQELLAQQAGFHTEDRTFAQSQLDSQAKHQAALEALQARQLEQQANSDATKYGLETVFHQQAQDSAKEQQARMLQQQMLEGMTRLPGTTPEAFAQMGQAMNIPGVESFINSGKDSMATSQAAAMQQMMGPVYSQFKSEPSKAQSALDILWQDHRMQSPAVQSKLAGWLDQQNAGLYQAPQAVGFAPQDIPSDLQNQFGALGQQQNQEIQAAQVRAKAAEEQRKRRQALNYLYDQANPGAMYSGSNF